MSETPIADSTYTKGEYFRDATRHKEDASFKSRAFVDLLLRNTNRLGTTIESYADVGCGSGDVAKLIVGLLQDSGLNLKRAKAYDVSPHVTYLRDPRIEFVHQDFRYSDESVDLVTLFDVFEHVPEPIAFLKSVALR